MKEQEMADFYSGKDEIALTDELIKKLVDEEKWADEKSLREMRDIGGKWNVKRNSVVFPMEFF